MAVTSLWRVKGYIGKVLLYAENPDKTTNPETIPVAESLNRDTLEDVISYAGREEATNQRQLVKGINCTAANARKEMMDVKSSLGRKMERLLITAINLFGKVKSHRSKRTKLALSLLPNCGATATRCLWQHTWTRILISTITSSSTPSPLWMVSSFTELSQTIAKCR